MGEWLQLFEGIGWFALAVIAMLVVIITTRVRRAPLQRPGRTVLPRSAIPPEELALLDTAVERVEALGFEPAFSVVTRVSLALPGKDRRFSDVYTHRTEGVLAWVERPETPEYGEPFIVSFMTSYVDGSSDYTINRMKHYLLPLEPSWRVHDGYFARFEDACAAHLARIRAIRTPIERDRSILQQRIVEHSAVLFKHWLETGVLVATSDAERWRVSWSSALKLVAKMLAGSGRALRARPKAAAQGAPGAGDPAALDKQYALEKSITWSKGDKNWLTLVSIAGFALLGTWIWGWTFMLVLLAVIAVHEMGHYLAMKAVGYRNLHVFFVPGLGGVATGTKADATPMQKVFVYLAGPVPGLAAALVLVIVFGEGAGEAPSWVTQLVVSAIVINFLNLLPVTPLDGGRIAEALLFAKLPLLRFLFASSCALALFGAGMYFGDWVLRMLGLFFALSLPHQWRLFRLESALPPREGALVESEARQVVFRTASEPRFAGWSFVNRSAAAVALVDELQARKPRWPEVLGGMALYLACLVIPVVAVLELTQWGDALLRVVSASFEERAPLPEGPQEPMRDWKAEIAAAKALPPSEQLEIVLAAMKNGYYSEDPQDTLPDKAWALAQALPVGDPLRSRARLASVRVEDDALSRSRMREAEEELSLVQGEDRVLLAELLEMKGRSTDKPAEAIDAFSRVLAIRESLANHGDDDAGLRTRNALAMQLYRAGSRAEAGRLLQVSVERAPGIHGADLGSPQRDYAGYLIAEGRGAEAESLMKAAVADVRARSGPRHELSYLEESTARRLLWAQVTQATPDSTARAAATLEQIEAIRGYRGQKRTWQRVPSHQLDRLCVAQAVGDPRLVDKAMDGVRAAYDKRPLRARNCAQYESSWLEQAPWERVRLEAHGRNMRKLELCPATSG